MSVAGGNVAIPISGSMLAKPSPAEGFLVWGRHGESNPSFARL